MKGKILTFDELTNRGIISGEDGNRYEFVRNEWREQVAPSSGREVDFETEESAAKDIYFAEKRTEKKEGKDWLTTLLLSIFLGEFGIDRFYTGHTGIGVLKLLTLGLCGILWIIDIIMIVSGSFKDADGNELVKN
jgi:TM2 domain-containing membrane protein YozV